MIKSFLPYNLRQTTTTTTIALLFLLSLMMLCSPAVAQQSSDNPLEMYGGSLLAMAGRDSIVLITDQRFGRGLGLLRSGYSRPVWNEYISSSFSSLTAETTTPSSLSTPRPRWLMTATGLPGDVQSLQADVQAILQRHHSQLPLDIHGSSDDVDDDADSRSTSARAAVSLISHLLYQRRGNYLVEPLLVGFEEDNSHDGEQQKRPLLCSLDMLGATSITRNYVCAGGAAAGLWGSAARYFQANLETKALVQRAMQAFGAAVDRDILSGYGALVHVLHANGKWEEWQVATRND